MADAKAVRLRSPLALLALAGCVAAAALVLVGGSPVSAQAAAGKQKLTLYSVATRAQYLNNADDRQRAIINNPWNTNTAKLILLGTNQKRTGPLPGDTALFTFSLFDGKNLKNQIGSSVFLCTYNFNNNAMCTSYYELDDGVLLAQGKVDFKTFVKQQFQLAVRGGTKSYLGARGVVTVNPAGANATDTRRLAFQLIK